MKRLPPLNALRAFCVAAQLGSFTKAGEALCVTQGAISRQVKLLEETLGRPLFVRIHQGIKLTETGQTLLLTLEHAFNSIEQVVEHITSDQRRQRLAINIPPTYATRWLAPRLSAFCALYPFIDLQITTNWVQSLRHSRAYDCLVVFDQSAWPKTDSQRLQLERHAMVSSPRLWQNGLPPPLKQQTLLHVLNGDQRLPIWEQWIEAFGLTHIDPRPGLAFSTLDQAIQATVSGTGVAIVDEAMIGPELASGALKKLSPAHMDGPYGYWFVDVARDAQHKAVTRLFREWLLAQTGPEALTDASPTPAAPGATGTEAGTFTG